MVILFCYYIENENEINLLKSSTIDGESILKESFNEERDRLALTFLNYVNIISNLYIKVKKYK